MPDTQPMGREQLEHFLDKMYGILIEEEERLGIPDGTLLQLLKEHDAIFVLKLLASIEPALNDLTRKELLRAEGVGGVPNAIRFRNVPDFIAKLPLAGKSGRAKFANILGVLGKDDMDFIEALAKIRNKYAHNIKNHIKTALEIFLDLERDDKSLFKKLVRLEAPHENIGSEPFKLLVLWSYSSFLGNVEHGLNLKGNKGLWSYLNADEATTAKN